MNDNDGYNVMAIVWLGFVLLLVMLLVGCGGGDFEGEPARPSEGVTPCSQPLDAPITGCDWKGGQ